MALERLLDWVAEPRAPHHALGWVRRARRYGGLTKPPDLREPVKLALSFDVEEDLLRPPDHARCETCFPFLAWLEATAAPRGWRTTLFVQGSIVPSIAESLRRLAPGHEIGLHGYYHELWGRRLWFADYPAAPPVAVRRQLIARGIAAFEKAGLPRPTVFRAPNLVCDRATLELLEESGFWLDSSAAAYRGAEPFVSRWGRLTRVPVTAVPEPTIRRWRGAVPSWAGYRVMNLQTFLAPDLDELIALVERVLAAQVAVSTPPHVVVLAHPWEFAEWWLPGCTTANYERVVARVDELSRRLPIVLSSVGDIAAAATHVSAA